MQHFAAELEVEVHLLDAAAVRLQLKVERVRCKGAWNDDEVAHMWSVGWNDHTSKGQSTTRR